MGVETNYSNEYIGSIFILIGYQLIASGGLLLNQYLFTSFNISHSFPVTNISFLISFLTSKNFVVLSFLLVYASSTRLGLINKALKAHSNQNQEFISILKLCEKFCDTMDLINRCLAVFFLLNIAEFLFHCIFSLFSVYRMFHSQNFLKDIIFLGTGFVHIFPIFLFIMAVVVVSSSIKRQASETLNLIHATKLKPDCDHEMLNLLRIASLQLHHRKPAVSCSIFEVGWQFLFIMIACTFSYIIILVQFDNADDSSTKTKTFGGISLEKAF